MNFIKDIPTTPGFYAWKINDLIIPTRIILCDELGLCCDDGNNTDPLPIGGEWCRLVPAEPKLIVDAILNELYGRAGFDHWFDGIDEDVKEELKASLYECAKRVMEGKE